MCLLNNKGLEFDIMGWIIIGLVVLVVVIGLIVIFSRSSFNILNILPF